ncbi:carboxylic acid reductase [Nocardia sp. NPDC127579]|uniref:carboxylic acid reductase n=1 Tax=Nocardia sp. NPDC127579 TaxID=3345402 RepID=UPI003631F9FC
MVETVQERRARRVAQLYAEYPEIQAARPDSAVSAELRQLRLPRIIERLTEAYADRPALGQRVFDDATGQLRPEFETITYAELGARVDAVTAAWYESGVRAGDFVAIVGFTSIDYTILDLACVRLGAVAVPMQASAPVAQLASILAETAPRVVAASAELLDHAVNCMLAAAVPAAVVVFDFRAKDEKHCAAVDSAQARLEGRVVALDALIERGRGLPAAPVCEPADDTLTMLIYTSGSTGTPKGAMYTEPLVRKIWLAQPQLAAINLNFMPLSHVAGRMTLHGLLARGGTGYFAAHSDMSTLFEDIALVRPTELFFVPRVCDMVFQRFLGEVDRRHTPGVDRTVLEAEVKTELREQFLGGRAMTAICGSAPLAAEMRTFIESVIDLDLHDGYGSTEAGGGLVIDNRVRRPPVLDYKLLDVPELGYFGSDRPHPRGELLLKTEAMIPGYFKRPDVTAEVFDADGFYRTGDIVVELGPDELVCVDRRNNVLKLAQGEFVTVAKLEAVFATSALIRQIYVYGSSERAYLLAVVVPSAQASRLADPKAALAESMQRLAREAHLESYEIPRDFLVETEPFSVENGLLSGIGKLLRPKLKECYGARLEQLYADLAAAQANDLLDLRRTAAAQPVPATLARAVRALLGCADSDIAPDAHFTDLGGDSLSALSLSTLLREIFEVEVPVGVLTGPAADLRSIAEYIEVQRDSANARIAFEDVHGAADRVRAADLRLERFMAVDALAGAAPPAAEVRTVLLTGANGYLGRFLCLEWLRRLAAVDGRLICLVRGADTARARARLDAAFDSGDSALRAEYARLAERLEVVAGDVGEPNLGVSQSDWLRLATEVDHIVHSAALVNHVLPYRQLFGPNVVGTAEIIRLALHTRRTPVDFLSTVAVAAQIDPAAFDEDADIRVISPVRQVDGGYANGYGTSKWAGEVLLREAHERFGLSVAVFRSDMILAHSRFAGQLNLPDVFTRLLFSVLATGLAPRSFYRPGPGGVRGRAHYDGLPADFTAAAVTALGRPSGYRTYDVLNPHDDDISLDTFVDWLIESGHEILRLDDYEDWRTRFEGALRALPEHQRQHSLLPLLHAYTRPARPRAGAALPTERFRSAVRSAGLDIPHLDPALIRKYASDLALHGWL